MGRPKRGGKVRKKGDEGDVRYEEADPESEDFFYDEVDKFHNQKDKIMLDSSDTKLSDDESEEELEEVLGLDVEDSDDVEDEEDDDMGQSEEEEKETSGLPSDKAWGRKKSMYYDTDYVEENAVSGSDEEDIEEEEEKEALALQQRLAAALDDEDFDTQDFLESKDVDKDVAEKSEPKQETEHVIRDLSQLSREEKLEILIKDSPELLELLDEFKDKLNEVIHILQPLVQMARSGKISSLKGVQYLEIKNQLLLSYCMNIGYYLLLKSRQTPVKDHPVIERLVQFRKLIKKLEPIDKQLEPEIEQLLTQSKEKNNFSQPEKTKDTRVMKRKRESVKKVFDQEHQEVSSEEKLPKGKKPKKTKDPERTNPEFDPLEYYEAVKAQKDKAKKEKIMKNREMQVSDEEVEYEEEMEEGAKRGITYEISKNKGLTAKKKKEQSNPRVKHKKKYLKAKIKRKSQVREVVKELSRYGGEESGIRSHLVHSVKIK